MLGYIRGTRTETGLAVTAHLDEGFYRKSVSYTHKDVDQLSLESHDVCPQWNYTISPQVSTPCLSPACGERGHDQQAAFETTIQEQMTD